MFEKNGHRDTVTVYNICCLTLFQKSSENPGKNWIFPYQLTHKIAAFGMIIDIDSMGFQKLPTVFFCITMICLFQWKNIDAWMIS